MEQVQPQKEPRYDPFTVDALNRLRRALADQRKRGDAACGMNGFYKRAHYHRIVVWQARGIHLPFATSEQDRICSCGLLVPEEVEDFLGAPGHRIIGPVASGHR